MSSLYVHCVRCLETRPEWFHLLHLVPLASLYLWSLKQMFCLVFHSSLSLVPSPLHLALDLSSLTSVFLSESLLNLFLFVARLPRLLHTLFPASPSFFPPSPCFLLVDAFSPLADISTQWSQGIPCALNLKRSAIFCSLDCYSLALALPFFPHLPVHFLTPPLFPPSPCSIHQFLYTFPSFPLYKPPPFFNSDSVKEPLLNVWKELKENLAE